MRAVSACRRSWGGTDAFNETTRLTYRGKHKKDSEKDAEKRGTGGQSPPSEHLKPCYSFLESDRGGGATRKTVSAIRKSDEEKGGEKKQQKDKMRKHGLGFSKKRFISN